MRSSFRTRVNTVERDAVMLELRKHARNLSSVAQTVATIAGAAAGITDYKPAWGNREQAARAAVAYLDDLQDLMQKCYATTRLIKRLQEM